MRVRGYAKNSVHKPCKALFCVLFECKWFIDVRSIGSKKAKNAQLFAYVGFLLYLCTLDDMHLW